MSDHLAAVRIFELLHLAKRRFASDVHIIGGAVPMVRIHGSLESVSDSPLTSSEVEGIVRHIFDETQLRQLATTGDVTCTKEFPNVGPVRTHASATSSGACLALRVLGLEIPSLEALGLPNVVRTFTTYRHGLVLFAGPTGSGKSTTLAALIEHVNRSSAYRIVCIEDPIEYRHANKRCLITQREIGRDAPDFSGAILGALRADPDIVVVGEMRDEATMRAVLVAAETGHLVFATLHTGRAAQSIDRMVDAFADGAKSQVQAQLAQVLIGVLCQRLVPCPNGQGRRAVAEVLIATDAVRNLIREHKTHHLENVIATGRASGMQTFEQHLAELALGSQIGPKEAV